MYIHNNIDFIKCKMKNWKWNNLQDNNCDMLIQKNEPSLTKFMLSIQK